MKPMDINKEAELKLLESIKDKPQYLHMGRTPVQAIELAWKWEADGYITNKDGWLHITEKGRSLIT